MDNKEKIELSLHSLLYILNQFNDFVDFHKVFKILYFADQKHLATYGNSISEEKYIAMNNGPVPSTAYDILKALKGQGLAKSYQDFFSRFIEINGNYKVKAKIKADLDYFSQSEINCLNESIKENKDENFSSLTEKSHDLAWKDANRNADIDMLHIAKAGGAKPKMIEYIKDSFENQNAVFV